MYNAKSPRGQKEVMEPASQSYYISDAILLLTENSAFFPFTLSAEMLKFAYRKPPGGLV